MGPVANAGVEDGTDVGIAADFGVEGVDEGVDLGLGEGVFCESSLPRFDYCFLSLRNRALDAAAPMSADTSKVSVEGSGIGCANVSALPGKKKPSPAATSKLRVPINLLATGMSGKLLASNKLNGTGEG